MVAKYAISFIGLNCWKKYGKFINLFFFKSSFENQRGTNVVEKLFHMYYVAPMSMETTGRQVGNLESWISDKL